MLTESQQEPQRTSANSKAFWIPIFWVTTLLFIFLVIDKQFFYYNPSFLLRFCIIPILIVFYAVSLIISLIWILISIFKFTRHREKNLAPFILFGIQIVLLVAAFEYPRPDYFFSHKKELGLLVPVVEKQLTGRASQDKMIEVQVPKELKTIKDRHIQAAKKNGELKIWVQLIGSAFGEHSFLLYKSSGKTPSYDELYGTSEHKSTYERKNDHWFLIDWND